MKQPHLPKELDQFALVLDLKEHLRLLHSDSVETETIATFDVSGLTKIVRSHLDDQELKISVIDDTGMWNCFCTIPMKGIAKLSRKTPDDFKSKIQEMSPLWDYETQLERDFLSPVIKVEICGHLFNSSDESSDEP